MSQKTLLKADLHGAALSPAMCLVNKTITQIFKNMLNQTYDDGKSVVELMYRTERVSKAYHMHIIYNKLILCKSALRFICTCTFYLLSPIDAQMIFICSTFSYN